MYSIKERVFLVQNVFFERGNYTVKVKQLFAENFPNSKLPHRDTVRDLINKFLETGSVHDAARSGRPTVLTEQKLEDISDMMLKSPTKSIGKLAQQSGISYGSAYKAVRNELNLYPYKVSVVHELKPTDHEKRINYCEWFQRFIMRHGNDVLDRTFFTDEAWFSLSGFVNSQNTRIWSSENPNAIQETPLHPEKIGVWCAISRSRIIGPIFFNTTVNSDVYCSDILFPFIGQLNEIELNSGFFQQDNATAHTSHQSMRLLGEIFGERIISQGLWPPRSPDLTQPDYFLWGAAKSSVYSGNPKTLDELKTAITHYVKLVTRETLVKVFYNKLKRVNLCIQENGKHFQHLL